MTEVKCPSCKEKDCWRCYVSQNVDVEVDKDFYPTDNGIDFSDPELIEESVFCNNCGFEPFSEEGQEFLKDDLKELIKDKIKKKK